MFVSCAHRRVVEDSGVGSTECVVHVGCMESELGCG